MALQGAQKSNVGDERISLGSLDEGDHQLADEAIDQSDSVGQENQGSQRRFEMQQTKRSFIRDQERKDSCSNSMMQLREPDGTGGNLFTQQSFFNNRGPATFDAREECKARPRIKSDTESEAFQSDDCDEKRSYTP